MDKQTLVAWLKEEQPEKLETLFKQADAVRKQQVGDAVHLRGLIEISNHCRRACGYCGISTSHPNLTRYRMTQEEVLASAHKAVALQYGTVVLQAGEDSGLTQEWITRIIHAIKKETPLAVTLSLGERDIEELRCWKEAGADRYLLRFETSDRALFNAIHPPAPGQTVSDRLALLKTLKALGYEAGSGVMVGIPGQSYGSLAEDILTFVSLDLDMIGIGPYIPHPETPLGKLERPTSKEQAPNTELMVYKMVALPRLHCPQANIPSTTALATLNKATGRELGLSRGANIVMPNLTPVEYRQYYEIYPSKACIFETAEECHGCLTGRIHSIGRFPGKGPGGRKTL